MLKKLTFLFIFIVFAPHLFAQVNRFPMRGGGGFTPDPQNPTDQDNPQPRGNSDVNIDSLREKLDNKKDSIVYSAKYIKYTKEEFLRDSIRLFPLDTTLGDFHKFNPLYDPKSPTMNLGAIGLAYRPMLFEPTKTIGFDVGFHYFDRYLLLPEDIKYYQAKSQYTELYYVSPLGGKQEQLFHVIHSQNIKPNWNVGGRFGKTGTEGYYAGQKADILNAALWNWYESRNKRYTLLANLTFNTIKSYENGSILNDSIFEVSTIVQPIYENTRLTNAIHNWRNNSLYIKQFYNVGKQRLLDSSAIVLPSQRVSHAFTYNKQKFFFKNQGIDNSGLLNNYYIYQDSTSDSTIVNHLRNEFSYSFYLRGKRLSFLRNELKLDVGLVHNYYNYEQYQYKTNFQNISLKGVLNYNFSNKANLNLNVQQLFQGRDAGDFLYQAQSEINLSKSVGKIVLGAYTQNQSPAILFERQYSNHYQWTLNFDRVKTQNVSFEYLNPKYRFNAKASYYLVSNHLYFAEDNGDLAPAQLSDNINLLKLSVGKDFKFGKFTFENYIVYQKTDFESVLRTPEWYTYHSFYMEQNFVKVLKTAFGFDVRYFSKYTSQTYAPAIGQFYNGGGNRTFDTWPVIDVWAKTNWKRANLFIRYDYLNQGWLSKGYYTVNQYPMPYSLAKFGLSWNFYD
jgi:hypothetical protein